MSEFDSPWKDVLDRFLPLFLKMFFPNAYSDINWTRGYESLDKELSQVVREAKSKKRLADKLFKVWQKNGEETWVLIHIEIQAHSQEEAEFARRIYTYNYRIFDRFQRPVATMIVLGDEQRDWRPQKFGYTIWGTESLLKFPIQKLLDYQDRQSELEQHDNPFALFVLAHLQSLATKKDGKSRLAWKVRLLKNLLNRELSAQDIRQLFRVIDWLLDLPEVLSQSFWDEIQVYEKERKMPVFTSTERYLINKGRKEGSREMLLEVIAGGLEQKFGKDGAGLMPVVEKIKDMKKLRKVQQSLWTAESLAQVKTLVGGKRATRT